MSTKRSDQRSSFGYAQSILDIFVLQGMLDPEDAEKLKKSLKSNQDIESFLLANKIVTKDTLNKAYSILLKVPFIGLSGVEIPEQAKLILDQKTAERHKIVIFDLKDNLLRIATSDPANLWAGFHRGLLELLKIKDVRVELFITGESDFKGAVRQYNYKKKLLLKRGNCPVVYLRDRRIAKEYLAKLPRDFTEKYRVIVFGVNIAGEYMLACQDPNSFLTKKVINALKNENNIKFEIFATSKDDFEDIFNHWYDREADISGFLEREAPGEEKDEDEGIFPVLDFSLKRPTERFSIDSITCEKKEKDSPKVDLRKVPIDGYFLKILPKELAVKHRVVIFGQEEGKLKAATDTPQNVTTKKTIDFIKKQYKINVYVTETGSLDYFISKME